MGRTRESANLVSDKNIFVDIANDLVGIGTTAPTATLEVSGTLNISGVSTFNSNVHLGDTDVLNLGDSNELKIEHKTNGDSTITESGGGALYIGGSRIKIADGYTANLMAEFSDGGSVDLYYNHVKKFETTPAGVTVTGIATATSFSGDGANLTNVPTGFSAINFVLS